jgi:hypothetical protein
MSSATLSSSPSASSTIDEQLRLRIIEELAGSFKGDVVGPDHADYERAGWSGTPWSTGAPA